MKVNYNMTKDYCSDWSAIDAIREFVQNAVDQGDYVANVDNKVVNISTSSMLDMKAFMLGYSKKNTSSAIGKYGEGFKLAMLRLTVLELDPVIFFDNYQVTGEFIDTDFGSTFHLVFTNIERRYLGTMFMCKAPDNVDELLFKLTPLTSKPLSVLRDKVELLQDRQGHIYVNGLWVCHNDSLTYGYNFSPDRITLNRDRNMVEGLHYQLAKFWNTQPSELVFQLLENDASDVQSLPYWLTNAKLKSELARLFYNKYGDGAKIGRPGSSYIGGFVSTSSTAASVYASCGIATAEKVVDPKSPYGLMLDFADKHRNKLRRDVRNNLNKLVTAAKGWR